MRTRVRWIVGVVVVAHGLIHLLGTAKGLGWAEVTALTEPISTVMGVAWLIAALLVVPAGVMLAKAARSWWIVCAVAALASQGVILTSWSDAMAGTLVNVLLLVAAGYGYASQGPNSHRAEYRHRVETTLPQTPSGNVVNEADLATLPEQSRGTHAGPGRSASHTSATSAPDPWPEPQRRAQAVDDLHR